MSNTMAEKIVDQLNAYEYAHTGITAALGNIWQDVILKLDQYDPAATEAADPNVGGNVIVLTDGSVIRWDTHRDEWYISHA